MGDEEPIGERVAAIEVQLDDLRRDFTKAEEDRQEDHKRLSRLELGIARDMGEIKTSLSTMARSQEEMAKDWRSAYGDKREVRGRWGVVFAIAALFSGFIAKVIWDSMTEAAKPVLSAPRSDATPYARHCADGAPWPCDR